MRGYLAFVKKEFMEIIRTYKLVVLGAIFLILGIMNPLTAKLTPTLLSSLVPEGMTITISEPSAMDSWMQFYKNVPQIGLIVLVIVFSGLMSAELSKGTLVNMLTKGLPRKTVILSKFTVAGLVWTGIYALCFLFSYGYTVYFWKEKVEHLLFATFCVWAFGVLLIACVLLGGVLFKSSYGSLLFSGGVVAVLFVLNLFGKIKDYNPVRLVSENLPLLRQEMEAADFIWPLVFCGILAMIMMVSSITIFNNKKI